MTPRLLLACAAASGLLLAAVLSACNQGGPVSLPACSASASSQSAGAARGVIVRYRTEGAALRAQSLAAQGGAAVSGAGPTLLVSTPDVTGTIARLSQNPEVLYAVPNAVLHKAVGPQTTGPQAAESPVVPTDQYASLQWAYPLLGYGAVWRDMQATPYTQPVTVAVLDTGVRYDHPDLAGALYQPGEGALDVLSRCSGGNTQGSPNGDGDGADTDPTDPATPGRTEGSHGTHVSGIIAARWGGFTPPCDTCSASGVVGAAYTAPLKILPVRVLDAPSGNGDENSVSLAIRYAAGETVTLEGKSFTNPHPAQVINLSLGNAISATAARPLCDAVAAATARGSLVVAAGGNGNFSGNTDKTAPYYPAACPGAVAVASVTLASPSTLTHAYYSSSYDQIALSAPGGSDQTKYNGGTFNNAPFPDEILSTGWDYPANRPAYEAEFGTSQATPQVSALAALLLSRGVTSDAAGTLKRMEDTATHLGSAGRNPDYGYGVINAAAALNAPAVTATP